MEDARVVRRHPLSKREVRRLAEEASRLGEPPLSRLSRVELAVIDLAGDKVEVFIVDGLPCLARRGGGPLFPVLRCLAERGSSWLKGRVLVDRGAAVALSRGANLMIPGVRGVEGSFDRGDVVAVLYSETRAPVMVGVAELAAGELADAAAGGSRGLAVRRLHYVGDRLWEALGRL